jgi:hypothetical protein
MHLDINQALDLAYITTLCGIIRFYVGKDGIKFGWTLIKTIARWAVGK